MTRLDGRAGGGDAVEFRLLGNLEVVAGGAPVDVGGSQPRTVLALLLVAGGRVVPADAIVAALWGDTPPDSAAGTLQSYVSRLRRALVPDGARGEAAKVLAWDPPGYKLVIPPDALDARRFEALADQGRAALAGGDPATARALLAEALALWRGPALLEFAHLDFAWGFAARLEERRLVATEDRIDADLRLGEHAAVVGELGELVVDNPLREQLRHHLALALYRSGRQAEARSTRLGHGSAWSSSRASPASARPACSRSCRPRLGGAGRPSTGAMRSRAGPRRPSGRGCRSCAAWLPRAARPAPRPSWPACSTRVTAGPSPPTPPGTACSARSRHCSPRRPGPRRSWWCSTTSSGRTWPRSSCWRSRPTSSTPIRCCWPGPCASSRSGATTRSSRLWRHCRACAPRGGSSSAACPTGTRPSWCAPSPATTSIPSWWPSSRTGPRATRSSPPSWRAWSPTSALPDGRPAGTRRRSTCRRACVTSCGAGWRCCPSRRWALEATAGGRDDTAEILAEHLWAAAPVGVGRRAAGALERGAEVAVRRYALDAAERMLERAVQLRRSGGGDDVAAELAAVSRLLSVQRSRHGYASIAGSPHLRRAEDLAVRLARPNALARLLWSEWAAHDSHGDYARADAIAGRLQALAGETDDPLVRVTGLASAGIGRWHGGRIAEATAMLDEAARAGSAASVPAMTLGLDLEVLLLPYPLSRYLHVLAGDAGSPAEAEAGFEALADASPDRYGVVLVETLAAAAAVIVGAPEWAVRAADRGLAADPEMTFAFWARSLQGYRAAALIDLGDVEAGVPLLDEAMARYLEAGGRTGIGVYQASRVVGLVEAGRLGAAAEALAEAERELDGYGERFTEPLVIEADARLRLARGEDRAKVGASFGRAWALALEQGARGLAARVAATAARLGVAPTRG